MPTPSPCVPCCTTPQVVNTPGSQGLPGTNGTNGINGLDAFTILTSLFTNPGVGNPTTVGVLNSSWMVVGEVVIVGQGVGAALANPGPVTCEVTAIPSSASVTLTPL